jgi:glycosyltransferase involved in cell wall biosynthesis
MSATTSNVLVLVDKFYRFGGGEIYLEDLLNNFDPNIVRVKGLVSVQPLGPTLQSYPLPVYELDRCDLNEVQQGCDILLYWGRVLDAPAKFDRIPHKALVALSDFNVNWFMERAADHAQVAVAASDSTKRAINFPGRCVVIRPGIDWKRYKNCPLTRHDVRQVLGFANDDFVVGQFCRFNDFKNIPATIDAVAAVPGAKLLLVGHGDALAGVLDRAERKLSGRFQVLYYVATEDLPGFYRALDAFCLLSKGEGYARVQWESQYFGVPFLGTPVGGVPDGIVDRETGFVVTGPEQAADVLRELKDNAGLRNKVRSQARDYARDKSDISHTCNLFNSLFFSMRRRMRFI